MKRSSNFLIAFAAAVITFGTLNLVVGPKHWEWRGHYRHAHRGYNDSYNPHHKERKESKDNENKTEDPDADDSQKDF